MSEEALRPAPRRWLAAAVALHFVLGGIYVAVLPLWGGAPDEPIHYSRIKYEGEFGKFALITNPRLWGEPLAVYCFTADPVGAAAHGPLYYATGVPIFRLTRGLTVQQQLYALRCLSLLYGAAMIPLAWWILGMLFPKDPGLVVAGTYVVLLHPHRLLMSAVVYNDIATGATMFLFLGLLLRAARDEGPAKAWFWAGCAFGLAFLAKRVALVAIPGTVVALLLQQRRVGLSRAEAAQRLALWAVGGVDRVAGQAVVWAVRAGQRTRGGGLPRRLPQPLARSVGRAARCVDGLRGGYPRDDLWRGPLGDAVQLP